MQYIITYDHNTPTNHNNNQHTNTSNKNKHTNNNTTTNSSSNNNDNTNNDNNDTQYLRTGSEPEPPDRSTHPSADRKGFLGDKNNYTIPYYTVLCCTVLYYSML